MTLNRFDYFRRTCTNENKSTANRNIEDDRKTWEYKGLIWEWDWIERCTFEQHKELSS